MRVLPLALCLALTGCITTDEPAPAANTSAPPPTAGSSAPPANAAAPPPASDKPAAAPRRPAQALRGTSTYVPPPETEPPTDPVLVIRQTCWSQGNVNKTLRTPETRADWVNKCVADKTKASQ